jgi:hypothetical protein
MGSFAVMPVGDLLDYLSKRKATGALTCERGTAKKSLTLRDGVAIGAASNDPREYLGQLLINFGHLNEEQLTKAFQTQEETKIFLGRVLVMVGLLAEETIRDTLAIKIRETILDTFLWDQGVFAFDTTIIETKDDGLQAAVPLEDIVREAEFRGTVWNAVRAHFPTGAAQLIIDEKAAGAVDPASIDGRLLSLAREGLSIDEIGLALHATDFHLYQRIYALNQKEVVTAAATATTAQLGQVGGTTGPGEIVERGRAFLADAHFAEAEVVGQRAMEMAPGLETARTLVSDAQRGLLGQLRQELLTEKKVPVPRLAKPQIAALSLTPAEKYLLARCNGARDLRQIVQISPLSELEILKTFKRFLESAIVELR